MKAKKVLVTGGGRGVGAAVRRRLAEEGFRAIVHYNSSREKAEALAEELSAETGLPHAAVRADLRREEEIEALFRQAGDVDVLVNNAGVARQCLFTDMSASEWDELFSVDVRAAFLCAKQVMPHMLHEKAGQHHQRFLHVGAGGRLLRGGLFRRQGGGYRPYQGAGQGGGALWDPGKLCVPRCHPNPDEPPSAPGGSGGPAGGNSFGADWYSGGYSRSCIIFGRRGFLFYHWPGAGRERRLCDLTRGVSENGKITI